MAEAGFVQAPEGHTWLGVGWKAATAAATATAAAAGSQSQTMVRE